MNDTVRGVALDFLRPHIEDRWTRPWDVMRFPPIDFQGWHLEFSQGDNIGGEHITLTNDTEKHIFSLKKLWVQVDKELGRRIHPESPRELAKMLIRTSVERHESLESLAHGGQGSGWYGYNASVGSLISARVGPGGKYKKLKVDCWHILVSEFEGDDTPHIFDLKEIYQELERELKQGFATVQVSLWEVSV